MESIFYFLLVVEAFYLPKVVEMFEEVVSWLVRGQANMTAESKLHSPVCSTFEVLVVQWAVRRPCVEELGPFC